MSRSTDASVEVRIENGVGRILLNRPAALNALTTPMVATITEALSSWREEPLRAVLMESASPKAFCAGGDIRAVRQNTLDGRPELSETFFAAEYTMNRMLATYTHPVVALVDGVCMGGGLGLSVHGAYCVVTERAVMAMPETAIGFFPDIGASYFLPRLRGADGMYLGLTGARVSGDDAILCGLATHLVPSARIPSLTRALIAGGDVAETLGAYAVPPTEGPLTRANDEIDRAFSADSVAGIRARLVEMGTVWAREQVAVLDRMSPASLELTYDLISHGRDRSLDACLRAEFAAACDVTTSPDFVEGVRAVLVDKDHTPRWR
jgi:enoyl-CoA hydratase